MGWIQSTNASGAHLLRPADHGWYEGLKNLEFVHGDRPVRHPGHRRPRADLFLPLASCAEKDDVVMTHYGGSPVSVRRREQGGGRGRGQGRHGSDHRTGRIPRPGLPEGRGRQPHVQGPGRLPDPAPHVRTHQDGLRQPASQGGLPARRELPQVRDGQAAPRPSPRLPHAHGPRGAVVHGVRELRRGPAAVLPGTGVQPRDRSRAEGQVPLHPDHGRPQLRLLPCGTPPDPGAARLHARPHHRDQPRRRRRSGRGARPVGRDQRTTSVVRSSRPSSLPS